MADYGQPPYHESAAKAALRMLLSGAPGWGAVPGGANFGTAFLASGGRSAIAAQQANQAAQDYAMRQQEMQRRTEMDKMQQAVMQSEIARNSRPVPEPKPEKPSAWVPQTREEWEQAKRFEASLKPAKEGAKPKATPRVPASPGQRAEAQFAQDQRKKELEQFSILGQTEELKDLLEMSQASQLMPSVRRAALQKFMALGGKR